MTEEERANIAYCEGAVLTVDNQTLIELLKAEIEDAKKVAMQAYTLGYQMQKECGSDAPKPLTYDILRVACEGYFK